MEFPFENRNLGKQIIERRRYFMAMIDNPISIHTLSSQADLFFYIKHWKRKHNTQLDTYRRDDTCHEKDIYLLNSGEFQTEMKLWVFSARYEWLSFISPLKIVIEYKNSDPSPSVFETVTLVISKRLIYTYPSQYICWAHTLSHLSDMFSINIILGLRSSYVFYFRQNDWFTKAEVKMVLRHFGVVCWLINIYRVRKP